MIIYNVTVNVENDVKAEWLDWMKSTHIPDVMNTGMFTEYRICRLIGDEDSGGVTYAVQYSCNNIQTYLQYQREFAPGLQVKTAEKYPNKLVAFRSLLEVID
jgi:hypothetical protein